MNTVALKGLNRYLEVSVALHSLTLWRSGGEWLAGQRWRAVSCVRMQCGCTFCPTEILVRFSFLAFCSTVLTDYNIQNCEEYRVYQTNNWRTVLSKALVKVSSATISFLEPNRRVVRRNTKGAITRATLLTSCHQYRRIDANEYLLRVWREEHSLPPVMAARYHQKMSVS